jgi:hypothetical protein
MFRWIESRVFWGVVLILAGLAFLLQNLFNFPLGSLFWSAAFILGGLFFLGVFLNNRQNWWALIPGMTLLSIGVLIGLDSLAPGLTEFLGGGIVLGGIALAFILVYIINPRNWWAIIPGGVLLTLALVAVLTPVMNNDLASGGLFFLGMGLTFAVLTIIPVENQRLTWAWIPAAVLLIMGGLMFISGAAYAELVFPLVLIAVGGFLAIRALRPRLG